MAEGKEPQQRLPAKAPQRHTESLSKGALFLGIGLLVGGSLVNHFKDEEAERLLQATNRHIEDLNLRSEACERTWKSLQDSVFTYKHLSDTLKMALGQTKAIIEEITEKFVHDSLTRTEIIEAANKRITQLEPYRGKTDSLEKFIAAWADSLEDLEDTLERYFDRVTRDSIEKEEAIADNLWKISRLEENIQELEGYRAQSDEKAELYRARSDSLQKLLRQFVQEYQSYRMAITQDSLEKEEELEELRREAARDSLRQEEALEELREELSGLREEIAELEAESRRADSLESLLSSGNEMLEEFLEEGDGAENSGSGGALKAKLQTLWSENKGEILNTGTGMAVGAAAMAALKSNSRYGIKEEFALIFECVFAGRGNMTESQYEELADCCAEALKEAETKYPSYKKFQKSELSLGQSCRN